MGIYISLPRKGRREDFKEVVSDAMMAIQEKYGKVKFRYPAYSSKEKLEALELGLSIACLTLCDSVYFANSWKLDKACLIEHEICKAYGIKILED